MKSNTNRYLFPVVLIIVISLGVYFRIKGLARWPVAVDEYYIIKSVQNILKYGLPEYISGGYYERGIIYQYCVAFLMIIGLKTELAARIIPVFTNILTLFPLYLLSKKLSGRYVALLVVFVFGFSLWEVEFARFGRMYSPFQMIFMYYLFFLFKWFIDKDEKSIKWLFILSFVSIFIYEGSIFLAILNFLPIIWNKEKETFHFSLSLLTKNRWMLLSSIIVFVITFIYLNFNFRDLGQYNLYPANYLDGGSKGSQFRVPTLLFSAALTSTFWSIISLLLLLVISYITHLGFKQQVLSGYAKFSLLCLSLLAFFNLYGLMIYVVLMFLLIKWITPDELKRVLKYVIAIVLITLLFWSIYILTGSWHASFSFVHFHKFAALKYFYKEFINYPYFYETLVLFRSTMPWFTLITVVLLTSGLYMTLIRSYENLALRFLYFILMFVLLIIVFLNLTYFDTRYFLFLYPLIIILSISALTNLTDIVVIKRSMKYIILAGIFLVAMFFSEDFDVNHLLHIDSRDVNFRTGYSKAEKVHFYPRWDTRSPAEYINSRVKNSDIVISNEQVNDLYLRKLNYIYRDFRSADFTGESVEGGKKERWTNAKLIYNETQFLNIIKSDSLTKWILINTMWGTRHLKSSNFFKEYKRYAVFANYDSSAIVYKIPSEMFPNQISSKY